MLKESCKSEILEILKNQVGTAKTLYQNNKELLDRYLIPWRSKSMQLGRILATSKKAEIIGFDMGVKVYKVKG